MKLTITDFLKKLSLLEKKLREEGKSIELRIEFENLIAQSPIEIFTQGERYG